MLPDPEVQGPRTRVKKIYKKFATKDVRRCSFTMRVTNGWNGLTNEIVNARKTSEFKARLDAFTAARTLVRNYDMYSWRQEITVSNIRMNGGTEGFSHFPKMDEYGDGFLRAFQSGLLPDVAHPPHKFITKGITKGKSATSLGEL